MRYSFNSGEVSLLIGGSIHQRSFIPFSMRVGRMGDATRTIIANQLVILIEPANELANRKERRKDKWVRQFH